MSMRVISCSNCDKPLEYKFGDKAYRIKETEIRYPCEECHASRDFKTDYLFCNWNCMIEWIDKRRQLKEAKE